MYWSPFSNQGECGSRKRKDSAGRLDFQNALLKEMIDELNRYVETPIVIGDPELKEVSISLFFKIKDRKDFLSTLEKVIPVTSGLTPDGRIVISRKMLSS